MAIKGKQAAFVDEYLIDFNATRAAERAGYKGNENTLASTGWENLRKPEIEKAIQERLQARSMKADEVIARLADQARGTMGDFIRFNDNDDPALDLQGASVLGKLPLVRKFKTKTRTWQELTFNIETMENELRDVSETSVEFELYSSQAALELLGKHHGLFDKRGSEDKPIHNIDWTIEQWRAEQAKRRQEAADALNAFDDGDDVAAQD